MMLVKEFQLKVEMGRWLCPLGLALYLLVPAAVFAGNLTPPAGGPTDPNSAMYTITDISNRLDNGTDGQKRNGESAFQEPTSGPGATADVPTLIDVMNKMPVKDDANAASPADVRLGKTYWGLKDGTEWGPQTGTGICIGTPNGTRWCNNGDGTVTDLTTGLIWLQNANCWVAMNWTTAISKPINDLRGDGTSCSLNDGSVWGDWRLPTMPELENLANGTEAVSSTLQRAFSDVQLNLYWSSTTSADAPDNAWRVNLSNGYVNDDAKAGSGYVWPVRGGQ